MDLLGLALLEFAMYDLLPQGLIVFFSQCQAKVWLPEPGCSHRRGWINACEVPCGSQGVAVEQLLIEGTGETMICERHLIVWSWSWVLYRTHVTLHLASSQDQGTAVK